MNSLHILLPHLRCIACRHETLHEMQNEAGVTCPSCNVIYPLIDGVLRFINIEKNALDDATVIEQKTHESFGYEWDYFSNWGFIDDNTIPEDQKYQFCGGLTSHRKATFDSKCRLTPEELTEGKLVLDAGCGNGRYTFEAASRGNACVIGVDLGTDSTRTAAKNTAKLGNVLIIQASLFDLPFKDGVFHASFSNGVLMHTGNAHKAFIEISRTIQPGGTFVVNVYHRLNPIWEVVDWTLRLVTTRLSIEHNMDFARFMARIASWIERKTKRLEWVNYFIRLLPTDHHMFDWYSAPIATHHTFPETAKWFEECNFQVEDRVPTKFPFWRKPWAVNLRGIKQDIPS